MSFINRREFLKDSAAVAAAFASARALTREAFAVEKKEEANHRLSDPLRVAVIGVHGRGNEHVKGYNNLNSCLVTTICDADSAVVGASMKADLPRDMLAPPPVGAS